MRQANSNQQGIVRAYLPGRGHELVGSARSLLTPSRKVLSSIQRLPVDLALVAPIAHPTTPLSVQIVHHHATRRAKNASSGDKFIVISPIETTFPTPPDQTVPSNPTPAA